MQVLFFLTCREIYMGFYETMEGGFDNMFTIEIYEYDRLTGNTIRQIRFDDEKEARRRYEKEKKKDFDYGDHYRTTTMFTSKKVGV